MAYDNNSDKVTFIKTTGSAVTGNGYQVDISSLLDSTTQIGTSITDTDEIIVVRKFDASSISPAITADEAWSSWILATGNSSGSTMYSLAGSTITFSSGAADYTWSVAQSGRAADIILPALAAADEIYILRKTYALSKLVTWSTGSKITSTNLNFASDQLLQLSQELMSLWQNIHNIHPAIGQPSGLCPLNASGIIASKYITGDSLALTTSTGISGLGTTASPIILDILDDSLVISGDKVKIDTQDILTSTSATKPLSAAQGKVLKDNQDLLGSGVVYKGVFNVINSASSLGLGSAVAGWTVNASTTGTAHSDFGGASVTAGDMFRYGTSWQAVAGGATTVLASGAQALTGNWAVGAYEISSTATKPSAGAGNLSDGTEKRYSTLEFVEDEIAGTKLEELTEVNGTPTDGDIIKRVGSAWEQIAIDDSTNGISIGNLKNVASGADAPSTGQTLEWSGSAWAAATTSSVTTQVTCSGAVTGDASLAVNNALNDSALGSNVTTGMSTSILSHCNFLGRSHEIGTGTALATALTLPHVKNVLFSNGTFKYKMGNTVNQTLLSLTNSTSKATTTNSSAVTGSRIIPVTSVTGFNVGDHVWLEADNSSSPVDDDVHMIRSDNDGIGTPAYSSGHGIIRVIDAVNSKLHLDRDLIASFTSGATVTRHGSGTDGQDQAGNIIFENMTFEDSLSSEFYLSNNPITLNTSDTDATFTLPSGHGLTTGGGVILQHVDATGEIPAAYDINGNFTSTDITSNVLTFATRSQATVAGTSGENAAKVYISNQRGVDLKYAHNVVFRNCNFTGWNDWGVRLYRCYRVTFENCTFTGCQSRVNDTGAGALMITESDEVVIKDCTFVGCSNGIQVYSDAYARVSSNIHILNNSIQAVQPISCHEGYIAGKLVIKDNILQGYHQNIKRSFVAYDSSILNGDAVNGQGIYIYCAEDFTITGNTMNSLGTNPVGTDTNVPAAFWGNGDGYSHDGTSGDPLSHALFARGMTVSWQPNRWTQGWPTHPANAPTVSNNNIISDNFGIWIAFAYNVKADTKQYFFDLTIDYNNISTQQDGVYLSHLYGHSSGHWNSNAYSTSISHNKTYHVSHHTARPNYNGNYVYQYRPRGIYTNANSSAGNGGRFIYTTMQSNILISHSNERGQGILLGNAASDRGTYSRFVISDNTIQNFAQNLYTYPAYDNDSYDHTHYGYVHDNVFMNPLNQSPSYFFYNEARFLKYSRNATAGNRNW